MTCACGIDWDDAFEIAPYIEGAEAYPPAWARRAADFRDGWPDKVLDQPYGGSPRARFDLFLPGAAPEGLVVFVHGGFWKAFGKEDWSFLARGALARGYAVALPGYTLAPQATLPEMTAQIAAALSALAKRVAGPVHLVGHSAGGHLVTRMLCADAGLTPDLRARLAGCVSVSGLHDLRPLLVTRRNEVLALTEATARAESAALCRPVGTVPVIAWAGERERPEFLRQSGLLAERWRVPLVVDPVRHHFDVIEGLTEPASPLMDAVLQGVLPSAAGPMA